MAGFFRRAWVVNSVVFGWPGGKRSEGFRWRWRQRFDEEGIEGLLRDKTRPPGIPPVPQVKVHAVVERTLCEPPGVVTHWTGRAMAKVYGS
jgi:homeodomain-containing protein